MLPIINFHNDLLGCVLESQKEPDFTARELLTSVPQMHEGGVQIETLALFSTTNAKSVDTLFKQLELYQTLLSKHTTQVDSIKNYSKESKKTHFLLAIENASGLLKRGEPFNLTIERLEKICSVERVLYISLTWNTENLFGGGNESSVGLKDPGRELLKHLHQKKIAIDLSHTSDALAHDLLNFIDQNNLEIPLIASHSNFRSVRDVPRNLPDDIAKELIQRGAPIGLNFVKHFVGSAPSDFYKHIEHGIKLGAQDNLSLGADFFGGIDLSPETLKTLSLPLFFPDFDNSSCYPKFFEHLEKKFDRQLIEKIAYKNALNFLNQTSDNSLGVPSSK